MGDKSDNILVSVIVPYYNTPDCQMRECIESIVGQTYQNLELIVIDDGSKPEYAAQLDKYAAEMAEERMQVVHIDGGGVSVARNVGIEMAKGSYIVFVDADDWLEKESVEKSVEAAILSEADIVYWAYCKCYESHQVPVYAYEKTNRLFCDETKEFLPFVMELMGSSCKQMYSREVIGDERFCRDLTNGEDVEFNFRVLQNMKRAFYLREVLYHYRIQNESAVRGYRQDMKEVYHLTQKYIYKDVKNAKRHKKYLIQSYKDFVAICYLVLNMNYIFAKANPASLFERLKMVKELSGETPYNKVIAGAWKLKLPLTRKMALVFAQWHMYAGVAAIMKVKEWMDR